MATVILAYLDEINNRHTGDANTSSEVRCQMTYKLNPQVRLIKSPVILVIDEQVKEYRNGDELASQDFDKRYLIESIVARGDAVVVTVKENEQTAIINWIGEEAVSFF